MATAAQLAAVQAVYTQYGGGTLTSAQTTAIGPMIDARKDAQTAAYLSTTPQLTAVGSIPVGTFAAWCAKTGLRSVIEDAAAKAIPPATDSPLRPAALALLDMLHGAASAFDLGNNAVGQGNVQMLGAWVTAGAITAAQETALLGLATVPVTIPGMAISDALHGV